MKTAAAMGVATAIAAGAHSVADSPVHAQASSEPRDEALETSENQLATAQDTAHPQTPAHTPSDLATDSARAPQAIQQTTAHNVAPNGGSGAAYAPQHSAGAVTHTPSASASTPSAQQPTSPTPSTPPASQPPASQPPSSPSGSSGSGGQSGHSGQGGLLTGVVDGVGGVLGGLLG